ncbi:MAG: Ppx/GppA family phosphatase [Deltaproteobacteria bacterium]|nr:Ppx/GppA family phosphatase [Deltaproteobacteria bacterium]
MTSRRCAFIDIGTNTILCLIVECGNHGKFSVMADRAEITRLGQGVDQTRRISAEGESRSAEILRSYLKECADLNVREIFAVGTSALRDAENSSEIRDHWRRRFGLNVRVISGEEEAAYSFLAAREGLALADVELLVIDIGGGSTELIRGDRGGVSECVSIDVGSVRLTERCVHSDPVTQAQCDAMETAIDRALAPIETHWLGDSATLTLVGIAGTFTTLAAVEKKLSRYSHGEVHGSSLSLSEVRRQINLYQGMTLAQRRSIPGLHPKRADVILAGAYLIEKIMTRCNKSQVIVSDQGVRFGLLYEQLASEKSIDING